MRAQALAKRGLEETGVRALLKQMAENGITEPAAGFGKGKYRFRQLLTQR